MKTARRDLIVVLLFWSRFQFASLACPKKCECRNTSNGFSVSCSGKGLKTPLNPDELPSNTYELDMSRNEIEHLGSKAFRGKTLSKLKKLVLSQNRLSLLEEGVFRGLKSLRNLDLSRNNLLKLNKTQFYGCKNLRTINLSNNKIMVLPDGLFKSLGNLKNINLQLNPIICDCNLKWVVKWMEKFQSKGSSKRLPVQGRCEHPLILKDSKISGLDRREMTCDKLDLPVMEFSPQGHQVAFKGDRQLFQCRYSWIPESAIAWYKDGKLMTVDQDKRRDIANDLDTNVAVAASVLKIESVIATDSGSYACNVTYKGGYVHVRTSHLSVISHNSKFCEAETTQTDKGTFNWHRTAAGGFALLPCPMGVMGRLYDSSSSEEMTAKRGCSVDGDWMAIGAEACAYANQITQALHSLKEETVDDHTVYAVSKQLLNVSRRAKEFGDSTDVMFAADVVSKLVQAIGSDEELNTNLVHTISNLAEVDDSLLLEAQSKAKSCSSMIIALDLFHTRFPMNSEAEVSVVSKNIAVQVVKISPMNVPGKTCIVTKETNAKLKDVECVPWRNNTSFENDAEFEASIHLPPTLTEKTSIIQSQGVDLPKFQFIVYFNSKLFPRFLNESERKRNEQVTSSIVSAQLGGIQLTNLTDPVVIKFRNHQDGEQAAPVYWDIEGRGGLGKWMKNSDCAISSQGNNTVTRCHQLSNRDFFAVMMIVKGNEGLPSVAFPRGPVSLEPIVFVGAGISCLLILVTLVTYIVIRELRFNRDDAAMLMNLCLALLVVVVVFAAGIDYVTNTLVCRSVGVLLHYFLLCSLLWLGCGGICLLRLIRTAIQPEEYNPVLRYYMISWGIPLIICGITIAGNPDNYNVKEYCWLRPYPFFGALAGPACLITIIDLVIFIRLHNVIRRTYNGEAKEISEAAESVGEENALVVEQEHSSSKQEECDEAVQKTALPNKDDMIVYLRGSSCVLFVIILTVLLGLLSIHFQKSRAVYVSLSCLLALTLVFLGLFIFIFHCYKKERVRLFWRNCLNCKCLLKERYELAEENAAVENCEDPSSSRTVPGDAVNEEAGKFAVDEIHGAKHPLLHGNADSQSNVSLPSSAAITIERLASSVKEAVAEKAPSVSDKQSCASAPLPCKYEARGKLRQHPPGYRHSFTEPSELPRAVVELQRAPIAPPEATASSVDSSIQLPTDTESNAAPSEGHFPVRDTVELLNASRNTNTSCSASEASGPTDVVPAFKRVPMSGPSPQGSDRVPTLPLKKIRNSSTLPGAREYLAVHRPQTAPVGFAHHSVAEATTNSLPRQIPRDHVVVREQYHIPYEPRAVSEKPRDHYQILPMPSDRTRDHYLLQPGHYPGNGHDLYQDPRSQAAAQPLEQQNTGLEARDQGLVSREPSPGLRPPDQHQLPRDEGPISRPHDQHQMSRDQSPFPRPHEHYQLPRDQSPSPRGHEQYPVSRDHGFGQRVRDHYQTPRDLHTARDSGHGQRSHDQFPGFRGHEQNQPPREQSLYPRPRDLNAVSDDPRDDNVTSVDPSQSSRDPATRKENAAGAAQDPAERAHDQYAGEGPLPVDKPGVRPNSAPRGSRDKGNVIHVPRRRSRNPYQIARDIHLGLERSRDAQSRQVTQTPAEQKPPPKSPTRETAPTQEETTRERGTVRTQDEAPRERTPRSSMSSWKEERPKPGPKDWVNEPPKSAVFVPVPHLKRTAPTPQTRSETSV